MQSLARYFLRYFSLTVVFITSSLLRVVLLVYAEWQDNLFALKFTDVDYRVLTDAARFVLDGESPFARPTYRYSPLLAPNHQVFSSFGKVVFVLCDLLVGLLIHLVLSARGLRRTKITFPVALWLLNPLTATVSSRGVGLIHLVLSAQGLRRTKIIFPVALWLLNPLTATVSSRGNAESILAVLVLLHFTS